MAQPQRYQVFHEPAGTQPPRWVFDSAAGDEASVTAARARADEVRARGGACTLLVDGQVKEQWNDPLKPPPPQPAGWLVGAGSHRRSERHELHGDHARVLGRQSQSDAPDKLDLGIEGGENSVSRRQCSVRISDGTGRATGLSAAQASGILRRDGARKILKENQAINLRAGDMLILDPLNMPYRDGEPLSPDLPAAVRFAYRLVVAPPLIAAAAPRTFLGGVVDKMRQWTGRGAPASPAAPPRSTPYASPAVASKTPSIKEMKATITAAGLGVADLCEKRDVVERYRQALAAAPAPAAPPSPPAPAAAAPSPPAPAAAPSPAAKRKRRTIVESDEDAAAPAPEPPTTAEEARFAIGDTVDVAARTFPGINKAGGTGTVTKVHDERITDGGPMRDGSKTRTTGFTYAIKYAISGAEKRVDAQWITRDRATLEESDEEAYAVGDRVEARFMKGSTWYPGAVTRVRPSKTRGRSSTFDVLYYDGEPKEGVLEEYLRASSGEPPSKRVKTPAVPCKRPAASSTEERAPRDMRRRWPAKVANVVEALVEDGADLPRVADLFRDRCVFRGEAPLDRTLKGLLRALAKTSNPLAADVLRECLALAVGKDLNDAHLDEEMLLARLEDSLGFDARDRRDALLDRLAHADAAAADALADAPPAAGAGRRTAALAGGAGVAPPRGDGPLDVLVRGILPANNL